MKLNGFEGISFFVLRLNSVETELINNKKSRFTTNTVTNKKGASPTEMEGTPQGSLAPFASGFPPPVELTCDLYTAELAGMRRDIIVRTDLDIEILDIQPSGIHGSSVERMAKRDTAAAPTLV